MIPLSARSNRLRRSLLAATAFVAILSVLAILPHLDFFAYLLFPGIDLSGLIFSNGIESLHLLRFEVASFVFNIVVYTGIFYFFFTPPRARQRRTYSEYRGGPHATPASHDATSESTITPVPLLEIAEDE